MKVSIYFTILSMLLFLFSNCSSESGFSGILPPEVDKTAEIRPTSNLSNIEVETRSVIEASSVIDVSIIRVDQYRNAGSWVYPTSYIGLSPLTANINNSTVTFTGGLQYYLANGAETKLIGFYPADGSGGMWIGDGIVAAAIDGKTDIMATSFSNACSKTKVTNQPKLIFKHLLSRVDVYAYAEDEGARQVWGKLNSVKVNSRYDACEIKLPAPHESTIPTVNSSGNRVSFNVTGLTGNAAPQLDIPVKAGQNNNAVFFGCCMFLPDGKEELLLNISTTTATDIPVTVPSITYSAGKLHKIVLKLTKQDILPTATIEPWGTGLESEVTVL